MPHRIHFVYISFLHHRKCCGRRNQYGVQVYADGATWWNLRIPGSGTCLDVPRSFGDRNSDLCIALGNLKEESGLSDIKYKNLETRYI